MFNPKADDRAVHYIRTLAEFRELIRTKWHVNILISTPILITLALCTQDLDITSVIT